MTLLHRAALAMGASIWLAHVIGGPPAALIVASACGVVLAAAIALSLAAWVWLLSCDDEDLGP